MSVAYTRQYRCLSEMESSADYAVSCHFYQRCADNLNNIHACVANYPLIWTWNDVGSAITSVISPNASTTETVLVPLGRHRIDPWYDRIKVYLGGRRTAGSGSTTWKIWSTLSLYRGTDAFDASYTTARDEVELTISSDTWEVQRSDMPLPVRIGAGVPEVYFYLNAENSDASTRSTICSLVIQPMYPTS